ncbi:MAG: serine/threonine protein kinase [Acidobacteria bacterium]|nr:MAG: serine/threonine protein kinase [Acidobacteriota bacterium]
MTATGDRDAPRAGRDAAGTDGAGEPHRPAGSPGDLATEPFPPNRAGARAASYVGSYRVVRELGRGGMAVVYEAEQEHPRRPVALKVLGGLGPVDDTRLRLFQREVRALARLKHPGIGAIYESGSTDDGRPFFAMELVRGETLKEHLARENARGPLDAALLASRLRLFRKVCDAVSYAHQRGIVHRDLKPSNVLVAPSPSPETSGASGPDVKVLDFGLARITDEELGAGAFLTRVGEVYGTLPYMSPEQLRGNPDEVDTRTDVYALGVVLYEMLAGRLPRPFADRTFVVAARTALDEPLPPLGKGWLGTRRPDADLETIVAKALQAEPAQRYQSVAALSDDVERYLTSQPIAARPPSAAYQLRKAISRHRAGFAFALTVLVLVVASAVAMAFLSARAARERDRAEREAARANAINAFLLDTLGSANPVEGTARDVTVLLALKAAAERVGPSFAGQPDLEGRVRHTIGMTYLRLGDYEAAEPMLRASVEAWRKVPGPDGALVVEPLSALGVLRQERGDLEGAEALCREALAVKRRYRTEPDADEMGILSNLAQLKLDQGKLSEAEPLMRQVLDFERRTLGPEHPNVALDLTNLGAVLNRQRRFAEAEPLLVEAVRLLRAEGNPLAAMALGNLGEALSESGRPAEAEPVLREATGLGVRSFGERNQDVAKVRVKYAACLLSLGRAKPAEEQLLAALPVFRETLGDGSDWTRRTAGLLVRLHDGAGRAAEADRYRALAARPAPPAAP